MINGVSGIKNLKYLKDKELKCLIGEKFQIIRQNFFSHNKCKICKKVKKIIVLTGGDDLNNLTLDFSNYLNELQILKENSIKVDFILGPFNNFKINRKLDNIDFHYNPSDLISKMRKADLAISASGQTLYELCYLGVPTIGYLSGKDQQQNLKSLSKKGAILNAGFPGSKEGKQIFIIL